MLHGCDLHLIDTRNPLYLQERSLRYERLRRPLGGAPGSERFEFEDEAVHLVAVADAEVVGCVLFIQQSPLHGRLFQMAVSESWERRGLGRMLVQRLEEVVLSHHIERIELHARCHVRGFYEKLGYCQCSDVYEEVGIPHITMEKRLIGTDG